MNLQKPKAILFDWDNTLVDSWPVIHSALEVTFLEFNLTPWTLDEVKQKVHRSMRDSFPEIFGDLWKQAAECYQAAFRAMHLKDLTAFPLSYDILLHLAKDDGIYTAVVSNKRGVNLRKEVAHLNWQHLFDKVIGADDAEEDKPSPLPIYLALEGSGIEVDKNVWLIGDSVTDMECAHNAGIVPIFIGEEAMIEEQFDHCPPDVHVATQQELIDILKKF